MESSPQKADEFSLSLIQKPAVELKTLVSYLLDISTKGRNDEDIQYALRAQAVGRVSSRRLAQLDPLS